jgi:hypothetical protein
MKVHSIAIGASWVNKPCGVLGVRAIERTLQRNRTEDRLVNNKPWSQTSVYLFAASFSLMSASFTTMVMPSLI